LLGIIPCRNTLSAPPPSYALRAGARHNAARPPPLALANKKTRALTRACAALRRGIKQAAHAAARSLRARSAAHRAPTIALYPALSAPSRSIYAGRA